MEDTNMKQPMQLFFFGIGAVTAMKLITYTASTYGDRILTELGWLWCSIEVKTKKLLNRLRPLYESFFPQNERTEVDVVKLSDWCPQNNIDSIDLMWMDTQGSELNIFKGMGDLLNTVKGIYVES